MCDTYCVVRKEVRIVVIHRNDSVRNIVVGYVNYIISLKSIVRIFKTIYIRIFNIIHGIQGVYELSEEALGLCSPSQSECKSLFKYNSMTFSFSVNLFVCIVYKSVIVK